MLYLLAFLLLCRHHRFVRWYSISVECKGRTGREGKNKDGGIGGRVYRGKFFKKGLKDKQER